MDKTSAAVELSISLLPRDVGFDLKATRHRIRIPKSVTVVTYADAEGNTRTVSARNRKKLALVLTKAGYWYQEWDKPEQPDKE